jgi:hypothetical protein
MEKLLRRLPLLLGLAVSISAHCQELTLDQVISLRGRSAVDVDQYLTARGWHFQQEPTPADSSLSVTWVFSHGPVEDAEVRYLQEKNYPARLIYSTFNRATFSAAKAKIVAYHMEESGEVTQNGLWSKYMGAKYMVMLHIFTPASTPRTCYSVDIQPHGLVKWVWGAPNEPRWITPEQRDAELARRAKMGDFLTGR